MNQEGVSHLVGRVHSGETRHSPQETGHRETRHSPCRDRAWAKMLLGKSWGISNRISLGSLLVAPWWRIHLPPRESTGSDLWSRRSHMLWAAGLKNTTTLQPVPTAREVTVMRSRGTQLGTSPLCLSRESLPHYNKRLSTASKINEQHKNLLDIMK